MGMGLLDMLGADAGSQQAMQLQGLLGGLIQAGSAMAQAGQFRPLGAPAPSLADAIGAFGTGRRAGMLGAFQNAEMEKRARRTGLLDEARSDKPDEAISPEARSIRGALAGLPPEVRALADGEQLPGLAIQRATQRQRPMTAEELAAVGFRPGTVAFTNDFTGGATVGQAPDTLSPEGYAQRVRLAAAGREAPVTWTDERDAQGNLIGQRSSRGQFNPMAPTAMTPGQAMNVATQLAPGVRDGTIQPGSPEWDKYVGAYTVLTKPTTQMVPDPQNPGQMQMVTQPAYTLPADAYPHPGNVMMRGRQGQAPQPAPAAQPAEAARGVPVGQTGMTAEPPPRITPQAIEALRKGEAEAARVADAIANFRAALKENGTGIGTWLNNPLDPRAQKVNMAYERVKMVMRDESLLNTGVLQPGENVMLEQMMLSPLTGRGAMAPYESYEARLKEVEKMVLDSYNVRRRQAGLPALGGLSGVGASTGQAGQGGGWSIRPAR